MSFGFAIGDFITVGKLAWTLYRECYQIARGAPQEFSLLLNELSMLSNSLTILQEEVKDPESTLRRAGDDRVRMMNEMIASIEDTLNRLRKVASKYDILGSGSKTKQLWARFKWSADFSSIDRLRNKLIYHNTVINLLLTSVGNSSLQRIESSNAALTSDVRAIKNYIASNQAVIESKVPVLSAIDEDPMSTTLSASLMINAEASQPWSTIGFDQWIGAGKWWLLRAQLELRTITQPEQSVAPAAYANLIKACWILIDVIPCHPQLPYISASKSFELQSLSAEVKKEFSRITALAMVVPALDELRSQNLRIWECVPVKAPLPRPYKVSQNLYAWRIDGGEEVLFRRFAFRKVMTSVTTSPCILLLLVHESAKAARLIAQDQYGDIFMATSFQEHVECRYDGQFVTVDEEKFVLDHLQEVQVLCTMIEATNFYILGRQADHASLEDLKAYMLLTALKNVAGLAVEQIQQEISKMDSIGESNQKGRLTRLALLMASQWIKESHLDYRKHYKSESRLLNWAVVHNHTALIEYILNEDPGIVSSYEDYGGLLKLSTHYGSATAVRWCLNNDTKLRRRWEVASSAYDAIASGHAKVLALFINAGVDVSERLTQEALRSPLSELVIHVILAMEYATRPGSKSSLRKAADRGHEGAIVLLSYASTREEIREKTYLNMTRDSGWFEQVAAALAKLPNILPAFDLTLLTVKRRRTQVLLKVVDRLPWLDITVYLKSYHAFVEHVPEGLSETHKKVVKIGMNGEFQITVVHQEKDLWFKLSRASSRFEASRVRCRIRYIKFDTDVVSRPKIRV